MRRPIVPMTFGIAFGIWFAYLIDEINLYIWGICVVISLLLTAFYFNLMKKKKEDYLNIFFVSLFCFCFVIGGCLMAKENHQLTETEKQVGNNIVYSCEIMNISYDKEKEKFSMIVRDENSEKILVNLYSSEDEFMRYFGDEISCYEEISGRNMIFSGTLELPAQRRNPKTFDYRVYLKSRGIDTIMNISLSNMSFSEIKFKSIKAKTINKLSVFKGDFADALEKEIGENVANLTMGMLFGEVSNIDEDIEKEFRENGTSHILSVSGLHVALVYMCVQKIMGGRKNNFISCITIILLIMYAAASQFSPSSVRAVAMIAMHIFASRMYFRYDMLCAASVTAIASLIYEPYMIFNTGFQLSYLAIFSLAVIMNTLQLYYNGIFLSAFAIQIGMIPATVYLFNYLSLSSIFANIPVIIISEFIIPVALLAMGFFAINMDILFGITSIAIELLNNAMIFSNKLFYNRGMYTITCTSPKISILALYYLMIFYGLSESARISYKRKEYKKLIKVFIFITIISILIGVIANDGFDDAELIFIDVGQGDCLHVRADNGKNILIDGGGSANYDVGEKTLKPYLLRNGVKYIDYAFLTHLHTDHYEGIKSLAKLGMIKKLFIYEGNRRDEVKILNETGLASDQIVYVVAGDVVKIDDNLKIEILWPDISNRDSEDENLTSLVMKIEKEDLSILMTGDIDAETEKKIVEKNRSALKVNVLKAAHHGSKYSNSDEIIGATNPSVIVFQVGKNNYGHPAPDVIEKIEEKGIMVYRNDVNGAIGIENIKDGNGKIITMIE